MSLNFRRATNCHRVVLEITMTISLLFCTSSWAQQESSSKQEASSSPTVQSQSNPPQSSKVQNLDFSLKPNQKDEVSALFENVVAVQRKAKVKSGKFLFNPYFSFDFSDSPYTMYGLNLNLGYALGEFWELYLNYAPSYATSERSISKKVRELGKLQNGQDAALVADKIKSSYGIEVNWVPIYGKDSWGPYGIIRSDTFVNLGFSSLQYPSGVGSKFKFGLGKTFFLGDYLNLRFQAGGASITALADGAKDTVLIGLLETGLVFYF